MTAVAWVDETKEEIKRAFRQGERDQDPPLHRGRQRGPQPPDLRGPRHYDMPWNPMRVEQRIGRVDRIGQRYAEVWVRNYFYEGTVEAQVYRALEDRIDWFENVVGRLQPILGQVGRLIQSAASPKAVSASRPSIVASRRSATHSTRPRPASTSTPGPATPRTEATSARPSPSATSDASSRSASRRPPRSSPTHPSRAPTSPRWRASRTPSRSTAASPTLTLDGPPPHVRASAPGCALGLGRASPRRRPAAARAALRPSGWDRRVVPDPGRRAGHARGDRRPLSGTPR